MRTIKPFWVETAKLQEIRLLVSLVNDRVHHEIRNLESTLHQSERMHPGQSQKKWVLHGAG